MFIQIVFVPKASEANTIFLKMSTSEHNDWVEHPQSTYKELNSYHREIYQSQPRCDFDNDAMVREFAILEHLQHKFTCVSTAEDLYDKMCACGFSSQFKIKIFHKFDDVLSQQEGLQQQQQQPEAEEQHQDQPNGYQLYLNHPEIIDIDEIINAVLN